MSCEIRTKGGKLIGSLSDSMDDEDMLVVGDKQVPLSKVYNDKALKDSFNDSIKSSEPEDTEDEDGHSK
ncbi:MAG: hypothetical protein GY861_26965 [bacterium]|nr:hypothetical protein [bacterium]